MIIVFFHVLYLIGKIVYKNYQSIRQKGSEIATSKDDENVANSVPASDAKISYVTIDPWDEDEYDEDLPRAPKFSPPAYLQRYRAVADIISAPRYQGKIKKVIDFGCSELKFAVLLKNVPGIEEVLCVDIDRETLETNKHNVQPLTADYLVKRLNPFTINVYEGSVTHRDKILANTDAVIAIELIEHLYPDTLMDAPYNIFGYIKPLLVIITTPNADFNVLFPNLGKNFRHWDHKFEWTRQQFEEWAKNITLRYSEYDVAFEGICPGPPGTENLGCCSQMAIFTRARESPTVSPYGIENLLKIVTSQEYPYKVDNRSDEEKILDEANYYIRHRMLNTFSDSDEFPLQLLMEELTKFSVPMETLREILTNGGFEVVDRPEGPIVLYPDASTFSDYENDYENDFDVEDATGWPNYGPPTGDAWVTGDDLDHVFDPEDCWDDDDEIHEEMVYSYDASNEDFDDIDGLNSSHVPSSLECLEPGVISTFVETLESNEEEPSHVSEIGNSSTHDEAVIVLSEKSKNPALDDSSRSPADSDTSRLSLNPELPSLCSIYLESSRNEDQESCPQNISNQSFDCARLQEIFEDSTEMPIGMASQLERRSTTSISSCEPVKEPQFTSSPRLQLSEKTCDPKNASTSQNSLTISEKSSITGRSENASSNGFADDVTIRKNSSVHLNEKNTRTSALERQKAPETLNLRVTTSTKDLEDTLVHVTNRNPSGFSVVEENEMKIANTKIDETSETVGAKAIISPEVSETLPNSWSPHIMDSGYPGSSSMQDITPEYDLSSIASDRISESESPSVEEIPVLDFMEQDDGENGDLANNNRDGEANNVMAAIDELDDDLQPLIDVLENDIENENDIYAVENGFPIWLLRIFERGQVPGRQPELRDLGEELRVNVFAAGDAGLPEPDEGFDGISSENDSLSEDDEDDDDEDDEDLHNDNIEDISTESGEEIIGSNVGGSGHR